MRDICKAYLGLDKWWRTKVLPYIKFGKPRPSELVIPADCWRESSPLMSFAVIGNPEPVPARLWRGWIPD
jgi:hypothetical protein